MKSSGATNHKLKQVVFRHLKRKLETELSPTPTNCMFSGVVLHPRATTEPVRVCFHAKQERGVVCDEKWGGVERACACPLFEPKRSKEDIKNEFKTFLHEAPLAVVAVEYPDIVALRWVLGEEADLDGWDVEELNGARE